MSTRFNLRTLLASALASTLMLQASVSFADDTEIFFGGSAIDSGIQPNVLFVLDNSGSMAGTRMTQLKSAFNTIMSSAGNINVGVMSMNTNPRMLSPVQDINKAINFKLATPELLASGDDATYKSGTTVPATSATGSIDNPTLIMGYVKNADAAGTTINTITRSVGSGSAYSNENSSYYVMTSNSVDYVCSAKIADAASVCTGAKTQINASTSGGNDGILLFRNLNIPASSTITSAKLILSPVNTGNYPAFSVKLENSKTVAAFNSDTSFTDHNFSATGLSATPAGGALVGGEVVLDITTALTNLKGLAPAADPLADIAARVRGSGPTSYPWYIGDGAANAPRLEVTWTNNEDVTRTTGIRFQNVAIPRGATITSARIDFVPAASDDRPVTYTVTAQNIADAPAFTAGENFTARTKTATTSTWTPSEWRTAAPQVYVEGPIVTGLVQSVIDNNSTWCGNNSMAFFITPTSGSGSRTTFAVDAAKDLQPVLNLSYTGGDSGCLNPIVTMTVNDPKDDGYQSAANKNAVVTGTSIAFTNAFIASRYQNVPVKQGATVLKADLIVTPNNTGTTGNTSVYFENVANSDALATTNNNISSRPLSGAATCSFTPTTAGTPLTCSDAALVTQLQTIFSKSNWADGNALSVILKPTSSSFALKTREVSLDSGVQLRIKLASGGLGAKGYTIREYTNGIVQSLVASGSTPIVPTLYDAAKYLVQTPSKHQGSDPSPITSSCQANYLVFLTDGEANGTTNEAKSGINTLTGSSGTTACTTDSSYDSEKCARTLVKWMKNSDMADYEGINNVQTSTIGFNTSNNAQATALLNNLATLGGGKAYQAENASDLTQAFDDIVQAALATNTTFVNSTAPVNSFNRADNLDQLYFALFKPSQFDRWAGNLKRYRLKTEGTVASIVDADDAPAIDANTGFFKSTARSFWNTSRDGSDITQGGAAVKLPVPGSRNLFTYTGSSPTTSTALESLVSTNAGITKAKLGDSSMDNTTRVNLISYIRGGPDATNTADRYALGDPIHSSPRLVTYGCNTYSGTTCTAPDITAVMGSNEGYIHGFNTDTGVEQFAFMPQELLPNIKQLRDNAQSSAVKPRLYGMDNTVSLWVNDANNNGVIYSGSSTTPDTGEFVYAYATMGRGGRNIYALDITDRSNPKILWQILGGTTAGFENLGQTWSVPVRTKIQIGSTITDVLIFGGGYDPAQDQTSRNISTSLYADDSMGNSIYIVNAKTGAKIWSAGKATSGYTLSLPKMKYSIPSSVRVIDLQESGGVLVADANKLADQFFVGDTGGQVWRFYINNGNSASNLVTAAGTNNDGVFASIGSTTTAAGARRFYNEPDVALLNVNGNRSLAVSIGSGYRGHPLNEYIQDRFYAFRTATLFKTSTSEGTLTESSLYDATQNLVQAGNATQKAAATDAFNLTTGGWYITLTNSGEKVLSRALTSGGVVYFNTYEPSTSTAACSAAIGINRSYAARLLDATPASVAANGNGTPADRAQTSNSGGISGDPQLFCSGNNCWVLPDPAITPVLTQTPPLGKTYWIDKTDLD